ncbi:MAG: hypothetical protein AAFR53_12055 [Pseudomonadota bacterium]
MPDFEFVTAEWVAQHTGFASAGAFLRCRERLEDEQDFPPPLPTCKRPLKWRASAVLAWVELQGLPVAERPQAPTPGNLLARAATA